MLIGRSLEPLTFYGVLRARLELRATMSGMGARGCIVSPSGSWASRLPFLPTIVFAGAIVRPKFKSVSSPSTTQEIAQLTAVVWTGKRDAAKRSYRCKRLETCHGKYSKKPCCATGGGKFEVDPGVSLPAQSNQYVKISGTTITILPRKKQERPLRKRDYPWAS